MKKVSSRKFLSSIARAGRELRLPQFVTFELSYGCNLTCLHCFNPTHKATPRELSLPEIFRVLEESAEIGVFDVCFTGGEPLARRDFFTIFDKARDLGLSVSMNSNATLLDARGADRLSGRGVNRVYASVYGASEATYEAVTGIPGSHSKFIRGIKELARVAIPTSLQMPVMRLNLHELAAAKDLASAHGFRFMASVDIYPRQDGELSPLKQRLSPDEKIAVLRAQGELAAPDATACGAGEAPFVDCDCGRTQFAVTPYGEMNLCTIFPIPKYDLRLGSVREGWEFLKKTVDGARPNANFECPSCDLRGPCRQGRADSWLEKGDMSVCLPHYKDLARLEKDEHALAGILREIR